MTANGPHFAVILDCCHSGSGTRSAEEITIRQEKAHPGVRPISSYIVTPEQAAGRQGKQPGAAWTSIASGRHILLAACRPEQTAKETYLPGPAGRGRGGGVSCLLPDTP